MKLAERGGREVSPDADPDLVPEGYWDALAAEMATWPVVEEDGDEPEMPDWFDGPDVEEDAK